MMSNSIPVGVGAIAVAIAYAADDPLKVKREVVIYRPDKRRPVGDAFPEDVGKSTEDLEVLCRLRVAGHGVHVLIDAIRTAAENLAFAEIREGRSLVEDEGARVGEGGGE